MSPNQPPIQLAPPTQPVIHATNAWNPTGRNLLPVPGTRLFYAHAEALNGPRTFVLLGTQQHLTFVADVDGHVDPTSLRELTIDRYGLYPHLVDFEPAPGLPRVTDGNSGLARVAEPAPANRASNAAAGSRVTEAAAANRAADAAAGSRVTEGAAANRAADAAAGSGVAGRPSMPRAPRDLPPVPEGDRGREQRPHP